MYAQKKKKGTTRVDDNSPVGVVPFNFMKLS